MENNRRYNLKFRVTAEELAVIKHKCQLAHCRNMSAFIRRMTLYGVGVNFPEEVLLKIYKSVSGAANNINQIAMRYHSSNRIYSEDINELKKSADEMQKQLCTLQEKISEIHF